MKMPSSDEFVNIINGLSDQVFPELLHWCIDELCGKCQFDFNRFKSSSNWDEKEFEIACIGLQTIVVNAIRNKLCKEDVLKKISGFSKTRQQCVHDCLEVRRCEIEDLIQRQLLAVSGPVLLDHDWKVKWVMGSSKLSSLREPLLDLDLFTGASEKVCRGQDGFKTIHMELDRNELEKLISTVERAYETLKSFEM